MRPTLAIVFAATVLAASAGARADDSDRRLVCREVARQHFHGPMRLDPELYRRVIERRQLYVRECMAKRPQEVEQTASVPMPLPPKRPLVGSSAQNTP